MLLSNERLWVEQLDNDYRRKFGGAPAQDVDLFYALGDSLESCKGWTAVSGSLPDFQHVPARLLHRASMCFLTGQERLGSLGWPVTKATAKVMGTTPVPVLDPKRAGTMAGRSMHLTRSAQVLLVGMVCFGPRHRERTSSTDGTGRF